MLKNANFLCEIGTEEIPAGYIPPAIISIEKIVREKLDSNRIDFSEVAVYATPRRFSILVSGLASEQREEVVELKGPSAKAAYDKEGNPTKALQGFLAGNKISADSVAVKGTDKGDYIFASKKLESEKTEEIIPDIIKYIVSNLAFPKRMTWSDKKITFPRPIAYFMILFNDKPLHFEIEGIRGGSKTRGHFVQFNEMIEIESINSYEEKLRNHGVILDQNIRKELIREELLEAAKSVGGFLIEDEDLLDTVTYLVESPHVIPCEFDSAFLDIPDIVLIAEMKEHQKYFAVSDKSGKLINKFLVTSNNPPTSNIVKGNLKVISARFSDAEFFYKEDARLKLADRVESLKNVLFHKDLGSIYDKIGRMAKIAESFCSELSLDTSVKSKVERAVFLSKADLNTAMVNEFASLQGEIGRIYALNDEEDSEVAEAIYDQYRPRFHGDEIPSGMVSVIVSLSEKIDNIFGSFSVGNIPKGSQDPYALRRQANAIVELILRNGLSFQLKDIFNKVSGNYKNGLSLVEKIIEFVSVRAKTIFTDNGFRYDEIDASMVHGDTNYLEIYKRAESLHKFRGNEKFSELLLGLKRMNNIVNSFRKDNKDYVLNFKESLFEEKEERDLYSFFNEKEEQIKSHIKESRYIELFKLITEGKPFIDLFFDRVMVMDKRVEVRDNRLYLLEDILKNFSAIIDFSRISDK